MERDWWVVEVLVVTTVPDQNDTFFAIDEENKVVVTMYGTAEELTEAILPLVLKQQVTWRDSKWALELGYGEVKIQRLKSDGSACLESSLAAWLMKELKPFEKH